MNAPMSNLLRRLRRRHSITIALLWGVSVCSGAMAMSAVPQAVPSLEHANQAFAQGRYAEAVNEYSAILAKRGFASGVLVNRGQAWLKLKQPGHAILDYERAAWLRPADSSITTGLQSVQRQAGVAVTQPSMFQRSASWVSFDTLGWILCVSSIGLATVVLIARSRGSKWNAPVKAAVAACTVIGLTAGTVLVARWPELDRAVVLDAAAPVRVAPAAAADVSFNLSAGDIVYVNKRYQGYLELRTADGRSGWADARNVAKIVGPLLVGVAVPDEIDGNTPGPVVPKGSSS